MIQSFPAVRLPLGGKGRRRSDQHVEELRRIAFEIVMRACGFASLAIFCVMIGFSFEPRIAFESGGVLTLVMVGVLYLKAREARTKDYRRTEMWLYLPKELRPPHAYAQYVSSTVLRETYLTFAYWTAMISIAMWALALIALLLGV
jgi:hypothetical protein